MTSRTNKRRPAGSPAADLAAEIERIAALRVEGLRAEWFKIFGTMPPNGFTKDLVARALTYWIQEQALGGLSSRTERILRDLSKGRPEPQRQVKVGSIIVREYLGVLHEVVVVPGGFCWQGRTYGNLSVIAKAITGTSWNGPRFFGLRSKREQAPAPDELAGERNANVGATRVGRRSSIGGAPGSPGSPRAPKSFAIGAMP